MPAVMRRVFAIQHTESEFLGAMEDHFEGRGVRFEYVRPFVDGGKIPGTAADTDGLVLLGGGPWGSVSGKILPSLREEIRLTKEFIARKRPVIGIGLGAQILCLAAGGGAEPADLRFTVGTARRAVADALAGYLPESYPLVVFMRDRIVLPPSATILAADDSGAPALFQIGANCLGFAGHPGYKPGIIEDLIMEFEDGPPDPAAAVAQVRAVQGALADSLIPIMTGVMQVCGLMRPYDERELARRKVIPISGPS